jgi:hypothetical protein
MPSNSLGPRHLDTDRHERFLRSIAAAAITAVPLLRARERVCPADLLADSLQGPTDGGD